MNNLYENMAAHPETGPVLEMLSMVDGVDDFSRALVLVRDCFSPSGTLRHLARRNLRRILKDRIALVTTFHSAVLGAAREIDPKVPDFKGAVDILPSEDLDRLRTSYQKQVQAYESTKHDPPA